MSSGMWISVDGVEAAGKTTLVNALLGRIAQGTRVAEFSSGPLGRFLTDAVKESPHYISRSPGGQSLVFLGEFWERCDEEVAPEVAAGRVVVHDRGYLSKFAYQYTVMEPTLGDGASALLTAVFEHLPRPDFTVRLTAPIETIHDRLFEREGNCDDDRLEFIKRADVLFRAPPIELGRSLLFDTSSVSPQEIADEVCDKIGT